MADETTFTPAPRPRTPDAASAKTETGGGPAPESADGALAVLLSAPGQTRDPGPVTPELSSARDLDHEQVHYGSSVHYPQNRTFFNGVNRVSNAHVEDYLNARAELSHQRRARNLAAYRTHGLRREAAALPAAETELRARSAEAGQALELAETRLHLLDDRIHELRAGVTALREKMSAHRPGMPLTVALLFAFGAVAFAAADYGIAKHVGFNGLDFDEREAVIFGLSVACMPLLLKPLVGMLMTRFVGDPWNEAGASRAPAVFVVGLFVVGVAYLMTFGWVRVEEDFIGQEEAIVARAQEAAEFSFDETAAAVEAPAPVFRTHRLIFFMLSSSLAGVAGAVCLCLAFGPMPVYVRKLRYWTAIARKRARARGLSRGLPPLLEAVGEAKAVTLRLREELGLYERLRESEDAHLAAQATEYDTEQRIVVALARDEYQRGGQYATTGELRVSAAHVAHIDDAVDGRARHSLSEVTAEALGTSSVDGNGDTSDEGPGERFMFQRLRQEILKSKQN